MVIIPDIFKGVRYDETRYPGAEGVSGIGEGANCQQYAYELLRHFGRFVPDLRSSDLWEDRVYTSKVDSFEPLDLLFFTESGQSWGAHIGVYLECDQVIHLAKSVGFPEVIALSDFQKIDRYKILLGAKRAQYMVGEQP